jgi:hypothetical protein
VNGPDEPSDDDEELPVGRDLSELTTDEVRRRTEAPLPLSLIEFLR